MIAMIFVGRLAGKIDVRLLMLAGLGLTAWSFHLMTGYTNEMGEAPIVVSGIVQGFGLGMVFVPLTTLAYATLQPRYRADAAGLFNLVRNIGSSIGISVAFAMLSRKIAISRTEMTSRVTETTPQVLALFKSGGFDRSTLVSLLNSEISSQATMIAYLDDFKLMMLMALVLMPLVFFMRTQK
jgi:DHA2 family multidrug resistance protein